MSAILHLFIYFSPKHAELVSAKLFCSRDKKGPLWLGSFITAHCMCAHPILLLYEVFCALCSQVRCAGAGIAVYWSSVSWGLCLIRCRR